MTKLNDSEWYITPEMYGALGDGKTDDALAIQRAYRDSYSLKVPLVFKAKYFSSVNEFNGGYQAIFNEESDVIDSKGKSLPVTFDGAWMGALQKGARGNVHTISGRMFRAIDSRTIPQSADIQQFVIDVSRFSANQPDPKGSQYNVAGGAARFINQVGYGSDNNSTSTATVTIGAEVNNAGSHLLNGRTEVNAISAYINCSSEQASSNVNLYNDWVLVGKVGKTKSERPAFSAVHSIIHKNLCPGLGVDDGHDGQYGVIIATKPGGTGFEWDADTAGAKTYPFDAGLKIVGWSGDPKVIDGHDPAAAPAYAYGIQIGDNGGVWTKTSKSKINVGLAISDCVDTAIYVGEKHPNARDDVAALRIAENAGGVVIDSSTFLQYLRVGGAVILPSLPTSRDSAQPNQLYRDGETLKIKI